MAIQQELVFAIKIPFLAFSSWTESDEEQPKKRTEKTKIHVDVA